MISPAPNRNRKRAAKAAQTAKRVFVRVTVSNEKTLVRVTKAAALDAIAKTHEEDTIIYYTRQDGKEMIIG